MLITSLKKRGRVMEFNDEAVQRFAATEARRRLGQLALSLLYDRTDWSAEPWIMLQIIPEYRLEEDRLISVGVPVNEVAQFKSWSGRLANCLLVTQAESREYHQFDFEDWITSRSELWLKQHFLPNNFSLYHERCFLDFIKSRTEMISIRLASVFEESEAVQPAL